MDTRKNRAATPVSNGQRLDAQKPQLASEQPPQVQMNVDNVIKSLAGKVGELTAENAILREQLNAVSLQLKLNNESKGAN